MTLKNEKNAPIPGSSSSPDRSRSAGATTPDGIEFDEQPFGRNSAWAPEGGQPSVTSQELEPRGPDEPSQDATHSGRTDSTTNSQ